MSALPGRSILVVVTVSAAVSGFGQTVSGGRLPTRWSKQVSPSNALPEYPRPQMVRRAWMNLNGTWDYALSDKAEVVPPLAYEGKILVPYPWESSLSGVGKASVPGRRLWYRRSFVLPTAWSRETVLLHLGAVNWDSTVVVNGQPVGSHRGGYDGFSFDITRELRKGENEIVVSAWNPVDEPGGQIIGKQRLGPGGIFYTACTGIWQSIWLEPVPKLHIGGIRITPNVDERCVDVTVHVPGSQGAQVELSTTGAAAEGRSGEEIRLRVPNLHLWTPADPHLYPLHISLKREGKSQDAVESYFAMRKIELGPDEKGRVAMLLNGKPLLQIGLLDQGYWPDGIYTAPTDAALRYDIEVSKRLGYNLLRKHAKVEPDRWYYWADRLGMLVWQDMPQAYVGAPSAAAKAQFKTELTRLIEGRRNHPSIVVWTTFNEGWGQYDTPQYVAFVKGLDPSRLVNNASGWNDKGVGDMWDTHAYPGPWSEMALPNRAVVNGEFGGVTMRVPGHMWTTDVMGYGTTLTKNLEVTQRYQELLKLAYRLHEERGTCAFVYTQLTDVEQESNGILTYDRAVIKPDLKVVAAANRGVFLPIIRSDSKRPAP